MKNNIKIDKNSYKILIIGANGFLGSNIIRFKDNFINLKRRSIIIAADLDNSHLIKYIPFYKIDITDAEATFKTIVDLNPEVIILTASMTNVDQCESEKKLATKINTQGPKNVLKACSITDSKLVFLSTDFLFDGTKQGGFYTEKDVPNPLNHYAKTKLDAEIAISNSEVDYLICRTSVLYGWNEWKLNFITWIIDQLKMNQEISIIVNQVNSPTYIVNLAQIVLKLIEKGASGIFNTAGNCAQSRYDIALKCAEIFELNKTLIHPVEKLDQKALRPKNVSLDISKLHKFIKKELKICNLTEGLTNMRSKILV